MSTRTLPDVPVDGDAADDLVSPSSVPAARPELPAVPAVPAVAISSAPRAGGKQSLRDVTISLITADSHVDNADAVGFAAALAATAAATAAAAGSTHSLAAVRLWPPGRCGCKAPPPAERPPLHVW